MFGWPLRRRRLTDGHCAGPGFSTISQQPHACLDLYLMRGTLPLRRVLLSGCFTAAVASGDYSTRRAMATAAQPPCPAGAARIMLTGDVMLGKQAKR